MDLFKYLVQNLREQLDVQSSEILVEKFPIINTIMGVNTNISTSNIHELINDYISRNFPDKKNVPKEIEKIIQSILEDDENMKQIKDLFDKFDPKFNRIYGNTYLSDDEEPELDKFMKTNFTYLVYSGHRYYCPNGWRRYSLKVDNFDEKYKDWPVAYHGTKSNNLKSILSEGLWESDKKNGRHCAVFGNGFYFSPSIEYCGHPRYAEPKHSSTRNLYIQTVIQCRLRPNSFEIHRETLLRDKTKQIDPNYENEKLEWLITSKNIENFRKEGKGVLIVYGIMTRVTKTHPKELDINEWWNY